VTTISFNGAEEEMGAAELPSEALARFNSSERFELWASEHEGPSLCMLRSGEHAFLMYLRFSGDSGFVSKGESAAEGVIEYELSNGQRDEYPAAWCIPVEQCYKAVNHFLSNKGQRPEWLAWYES
jgi:hypothetical protein